MEKRARARELAIEYLTKKDPTGWFEQLYREAEEGKSSIPWADLQPNPNLIKFWAQHPISGSGKTALTVGCGFGDDAEQLVAWGFRTTAFDISASAIKACKRRFPGSEVHYAIADLLRPPSEWINRFDLVLESYTLQVLPRDLRDCAIAQVSDFVREGGYLLLITRGREEQEDEGQMPWPLTRYELEKIIISGFHQVLFEDYLEEETPPVRRFRALYQRPPART